MVSITKTNVLEGLLYNLWPLCKYVGMKLSAMLNNDIISHDNKQLLNNPIGNLSQQLPPLFEARYI